jgi:hypothetical protein
MTASRSGSPVPGLRVRGGLNRSAEQRRRGAGPAVRRAVTVVEDVVRVTDLAVSIGAPVHRSQLIVGIRAAKVAV